MSTESESEFEYVPEEHYEELMLKKGEYDPISFRCEAYAKSVYNQKTEGWCVPVTYSDVLTQIYRVYGGEPEVVLSPQPLIDCGRYQHLKELSKILCDSAYGLVGIEEYPFNWKTKDKQWDWDVYEKMDFQKRYFVNQLYEYKKKKEIRKRLCHNFMPGGRQYPLVGGLNMRDFARKDEHSPAILAADVENPAYRCPRKMGTKAQRRKSRSDKFDHAVLIFGLDTTHDDPSEHWCWVKSSYGRDWGKDGVSRVVIKDLKRLIVPRYGHEELTVVRAKEAREKREKAVAAAEEKPNPILFAGSNEAKAPTRRKNNRRKKKKNDRKGAFGMDDQTKIGLEILDNGEVQVTGKERESQLSNQFRDIATIVMQKTINPETRCPYTISMVERLMHENHFAVDPNSSSKKQALDVIRELQEHFPIKRSPTRLKLTLPLQNFTSLEEKLSEWKGIIVSKDESGSQLSIVCEMDPGLFCDCDALLRNLQGSSEILAISVRGEGDINADHYDGHDDVSSSESKKPTDPVDQLSEKMQKQTLAPNY